MSEQLTEGGSWSLPDEYPYPHRFDVDGAEAEIAAGRVDDAAGKIVASGGDLNSEAALDVLDAVAGGDAELLVEPYVEQ